MKIVTDRTSNPKPDFFGVESFTCVIPEKGVCLLIRSLNQAGGWFVCMSSNERLPSILSSISVRDIYENNDSVKVVEISKIVTVIKE